MATSGVAVRLVSGPWILRIGNGARRPAIRRGLDEPGAGCTAAVRGEPRGFTWAGYRDLITAAHHSLSAPLVWVWDNLNSTWPRNWPGSRCGEQGMAAITGCPRTRRT